MVQLDCYFAKMIKTSRNEQILATVNHYLKRRQYMEVSDIAQKKLRLSICSVKEMVMSSAVLNSGSSGIAVSFSSLTGDAAHYDQQYIRAKVFVSEAAEPFKSELSLMLFPHFVRIYLELISGGQKLAAQKFFAKHHAMFEDVEEATPLMTNLLSVTNRDEMLANKTVHEFWEHRYKVTLSDESLQYFLKFLKSEDNLLLLQIITQHLDISVKGKDSAADDSTVEDESDELASLSAAAPESNIVTSPPDVTLESLQRVITKMNEGPPPLPSICLYSIICPLDEGPSSITMSPDEGLICAGFEDSHIQIWGLSPGSLPSPPPVFGVNHLRLGDDHPEDIEARLSKEREKSSDSIILRGHSDTVYSLSFLNSRRYLLSASGDKTVRLWDTEKCSNVVVYRGHNYPVVGVDSSAVNSYFASCSFDQTCQLWCSNRNYPLRTFIGHTRTVNCVKFHPNGNYLATGSSDMSIRLWSLQDAESKRVLTDHKGMVTALAFSPNGQYLASAGDDHRIKIWDLSTSRVVKDFKGHTETVYSLAFSRCNSLLASGGHDYVINLWDVGKTSCPNTNVDVTTTPPSEPLGSFPTKSVSIYHLNFSKRNYLQAAGS